MAVSAVIDRLPFTIALILKCTQRIDVLVFTGGVGENCAEVSDGALAQLAFLNATVRTLVVPTREEWEIARECARMLAS